MSPDMSTLPDRILSLFATLHLRRENAVADIESLYADDVHFVDPFHDVRGRDAFVAATRALFRHFEEVRFDELEVVGSEPHFVISWVCHMRPKVGPSITARGVSEIRSRGGVVVEHVDHWDAMSSLADTIPGVGALYKRMTARLFSGISSR